MTPEEHRVLDIIAPTVSKTAHLINQALEVAETLEEMRVKQIIKLEQVFLSPTTLMNILRRPEIKITRVYYELGESKDFNFEFIFSDLYSATLLIAVLKAYGHTAVTQFTSAETYCIEIGLANNIDKKQMMVELNLHKFPVEESK